MTQQLSIDERIKEHERRLISASELARLLLPVCAIAGTMLVNQLIPDAIPQETGFFIALLSICMGVYCVFLAGAVLIRSLRVKMLHLSWYLVMLFFLIACYDIATTKTASLDSLLTVPPEAIASSVPLNLNVVVTNALGSVLLLAEGMVWGLVAGVLSGILMGWSYLGNYWLSPLLKVIGPVPSAVWLPIAMIIFPTSHVASVFVISIAVWFPLTLNLGSAIRDTDKRQIESARCLGATTSQVLFRVALPAAMPSLFTGAFMGLSASFGALVFAEMLGVEAGLGWYIMASKQVFSFGRVLSSVIIFIIAFSVLTAILFKIRDRVLKWQKGYIHW